MSNQALEAAIAPVTKAMIGSIMEGSLAHTEKCASAHFAPWMIEEHWFMSAVEAVKSGTLKAAIGEPEENNPNPPYTVHNGIAVVPINGPMMKAKSKYGGTSTVSTRQAIRKAIYDDNVSSILLHIDSPGGTVAGTAELAADVKNADAVKPVYAHIEDLGASAAYWVASQARRITANATARIGSIGTLLVLDDTSGAYAARGIKVHVISTGKFKGAGTDGAPLTDEHIEMFREGVNDLNEHFLNGVSAGRKMNLAAVRNVADGRVHIAAKAKDLGLIDAVASLEDAASFIHQSENSAVVHTHTSTTPEAPSREDANQASFSKEIKAMPESTPISTPPANVPAAGPANAQGQPTSQDVLASLNLQTASNHYERGRGDGLRQGREQAVQLMQEIIQNCPGDYATAVNAFITGQTPGAVKLAYEAAKRERESAQAQISAMQIENARQMALASAGGYPNGVSQRAGSNEFSVPTGTDPEVQAKMEWDANANNCRHGCTERNYMLARVAQLKGNVRILSRTA